MKRVSSVFIVVVVSIILSITTFSAETPDLLNNINLNRINQDKIDNLVYKILEESKIPGVSIVIVNKEQTKYFLNGLYNFEWLIYWLDHMLWIYIRLKGIKLLFILLKKFNRMLYEDNKF